MPLRFLQYVAQEYEKLTAMESLYGKRLIQIPAPKFVVFYNGVDEQSKRRVLKLSDAFTNLAENVREVWDIKTHFELIIHLVRLKEALSGGF